MTPVQMPRNTIHLIAPSFVLSPAELELGVERLRGEGFRVKVDAQCRKKHFYLAGDDETRARALYDAAMDPESQVVWCARGGYGAGRLLPLLEALTKMNGAPPKKLFAGYSDSTALFDFVRTRWGWSVTHSPMPGFRSFCTIPEREFRALVATIRGVPRPEVYPWHGKKLKFHGPKPAKAVEAEMVGGNLSVWSSLGGSPYAGDLRDKMLFLEDVDETFYRLDRYLLSMKLAGSLKGVKAIVLGHFEGCVDRVGRALKTLPASPKARARVIQKVKESELGPMRPLIAVNRGFDFIFGSLGRELGIPVVHGLKVGHGAAGQCPLPLNARYRIEPDGTFEIVEWDGWTGARD